MPGRFSVSCRSVETSRIQFAYKAYRRPFRQPVRTSQGIWEAREGIVLRVESEAGRVSFGEIAPIERFGTETLAGAVAWCATVGLRTDLNHLQSVPWGMPCCAAAVSALVAQFHERTGSRQEAAVQRLPVAALLPTGEAAIDALARGLDQGFTTFKIKIGAANFDEELALLHHLAEQLDGVGQLRCDANGACDVRAAGKWLAAAADWPVEFVEQPLSAGAVEDLLAVANDFSTPIALDESVLGADDIKRWRDRGWQGVFVVKPSLAGDRNELLNEVRIEPERFVFSSALESDIGMRAGIGLAFDAGATRALGYGVSAFFPRDGLGGGWDRPEVSSQDCGGFNPETLWNQL